MTNKINHLAVWVLVVVHQVVGWAWYTIFGEKWLNLHARTMRYRADPQRRRLRSGVCYGDCCQLCAGVADLSNEWLECNCRVESRTPLLVRVSFRRTRDHRRVLVLRNEPVAAYPHRHGPAIRELCNQRLGPRRLA